MTHPPPPDVATVLQTLVRTARLGDVTVEYWTGGGHPPPYYRSDQFRLLSVAGQDILELARPRYDVPAPPDSPLASGYVTEKFQLPARPEDVRTVVRLLLSTEVFTRHYPEEDGPAVPDGLSTEVLLTVGPHGFTRKYYRAVPSAVEPLRDVVVAMIHRVTTTGTHGLFHQGRPLSVNPWG